MYTIGVILAVVMLVFAIYFGGPWYVGGPSTAIGSAFDADIARALLSILYMIPCVATFVGTVKDGKYRRIGSFGVAACFAFVTLLRLLTFGLTPVIWIFTFACGIIAGIVYIHESINEEE